MDSRASVSVCTLSTSVALPDLDLVLVFELAAVAFFDTLIAGYDERRLCSLGLSGQPSF